MLSSWPQQQLQFRGLSLGGGCGPVVCTLVSTGAGHGGCWAPCLREHARVPNLLSLLLHHCWPGAFPSIDEIPENVVHDHEKNGLPRLSSFSDAEIQKR